MHQLGARQEKARILLWAPEAGPWPSAGLPRRLLPALQTQQLERPGACVLGQRYGKCLWLPGNPCITVIHHHHKRRSGMKTLSTLPAPSTQH